MAGRQGAGAARGPPAATAAAGPEIDPATLSEERNSRSSAAGATDEQRRDLLAKYGHARAEARQRKMEAAYAPRPGRAPPQTTISGMLGQKPPS